jgi:hypothetical protein
MAISKPNLAPSIKFTETDLTFTTRNFGVTSLGISGEFPKGRAFTPIAIDNTTLFKQVFGDSNPCKFEGTEQPVFEGVYICLMFEQLTKPILGLCHNLETSFYIHLISHLSNHLLSH